MLSLGTFFGALAAAPIADGIGRKLGIMISCVVFSIGVAMQAAATHTPLFVLGRVGAGLGVGLVSCMIPMYQVRLCLQIQGRLTSPFSQSRNVRLNGSVVPSSLAINWQSP